MIELLFALLVAGVFYGAYYHIEIAEIVTRTIGHLADGRDPRRDPRPIGPPQPQIILSPILEGVSLRTQLVPSDQSSQLLPNRSAHGAGSPNLALNGPPGYASPESDLPKVQNTMLAMFRPNPNSPMDCLVFNGDGACISQVMTEDQAKQFASKVVNGRIPQFAGTIECYVMRVSPIARVRDSTMANTSIEEIAPAPTANRVDARVIE